MHLADTFTQVTCTAFNTQFSVHAFAGRTHTLYCLNYMNRMNFYKKCINQDITCSTFETTLHFG